MSENLPHLEIDITVANPARVCDYLLGGKDNFAVDREVAEHMTRAHHGGIETARTAVRAHRAFLGRAVRHLVSDAGIRQFLDIGCGIPTACNTHQVAQKVAPECRIVYVDHDPVVLAHAHKLLRSGPEGGTDFLLGDLRQPERILPAAAETLDLTQPVAIILVAVLHFIRDEDDPYGIVQRLIQAIPSGSHLVVLHMASDLGEEMGQVVERHNEAKVQDAAVLRDHDQIARFFEGLELVEPGLVQPDRWRPDSGRSPNGLVLPSYGGVGRKP